MAFGAPPQGFGVPALAVDIERIASGVWGFTRRELNVRLLAEGLDSSNVKYYDTALSLPEGSTLVAETYGGSGYCAMILPPEAELDLAAQYFNWIGTNAVINEGTVDAITDHDLNTYVGIGGNASSVNLFSVSLPSAQPVAIYIRAWLYELNTSLTISVDGDVVKQYTVNVAGGTLDIDEFIYAYGQTISVTLAPGTLLSTVLRIYEFNVYPLQSLPYKRSVSITVASVLRAALVCGGGTQYYRVYAILPW